MKYFQTDDRDDYFATLSKNKKLRIKPTYSIFKDDKIILNNELGYKCITFTKTLVNMTRKELSHNNWKNVLINLGYIIK